MNSAALRPASDDVAAAFADHHVKSPRERFVLVAIAAAPNASPEQLAEMTGMRVETTLEAVSELMRDDEIYVTMAGGYITTSAAVVA